MNRPFCWTLAALLCTWLIVGCGPRSPEQQSKIDVSKGLSDMEDAQEIKKAESEVVGDAQNMTQVESPEALYQKALAELHKAIEQDPNNADAHYQLGFANLEHGEVKLAITYFTRTIKLDPKHARAYLMRSRAYGELGDALNAKQDRDKALELDPKIDD